MAASGGREPLHRREEEHVPHGTAPNSRPSPPARLQLTKEEMEVLQQCSKESFWLRSFPLAVVLIGGTSIFVRKGLLSPHPRFGAVPKSMFAGLVAYVLGKMSYQEECRRKIMNLENSPLAEAMRKGKRGRELIGEMSLPGLGVYEPSSSEQNVEMDRKLLSESYDSNNQAPGLDDAQRPDIDNAMEQQHAHRETQAQYLSYEELRKRNRGEYEQRASQSTSSPRQFTPAPSQVIEGTPPRQSAPSRGYEQPQRRPRTNKYGDVIEE